MSAISIDKSQSPQPVFNSNVIREARESSLTGPAPQARSATSSPSPRPAPYPLVRSNSVQLPSVAPNLKPSPVAFDPTAPLNVKVSETVSPIVPDYTPTAVLPVDALSCSTTAPPSNLPETNIKTESRSESVIDPDLLALDELLPKPSIPTVEPTKSDKLIETTSLGLNQTQFPKLSFPSFPQSQIPTLNNPHPTAPNAADLLSRHPLSLQTALDTSRFSLPHPDQSYSGSGETSTESSYPPFSLPGSGSESVSQDMSPVTPSDDGGSVYEPGETSALYNDESEVGDKVETGIPAPKGRGRVKKSHARKQPEGHIKRARNAFILFRKHITDSNLIPATVEVKHQNISVVAAKMWREAPQDVRAKFQEMARIEKEEHQRKYPGYRYQPIFRRTDIIRRRVRKDGTEDEKVDAVAEALIQGKAGGELEKEIKEQDLVGEDVDITPEGSAARSRSRRRRDPGQLSKGAMRAQKAQHRQKQMRQNLLGHNLLNVSLFNAQQQQQQQAQRVAAIQAIHQSQQHQRQQHEPLPSLHAQYPPHDAYSHGPGMEHYMPMSMGMQPAYDVDEHGRMMLDPYGPSGSQYPQQGYSGEMAYGPGGEYPAEMYHLPRMAGYDDQPAYELAAGGIEYYGHSGQEGMESQAMSPYGYSHPPGPGAQGPGYGLQGSYDTQDSYRFPPLQSPSLPMGLPATGVPTSEQGGSLQARVEDEPAGQDWDMPSQTTQVPSGHVLFNDGLFDGELGKDDGITDFDEAMQQASEMW